LAGRGKEFTESDDEYNPK
jgi:hypothetical protein